MTVKVLTEHHFGFLSLKGGSTGSSESTHVNMAHFWKSRALAHLFCYRHLQQAETLTITSGIHCISVDVLMIWKYG